MSSKRAQIQWVNDQIAFYLSQEVQSHHVFDEMLERIERADEMIISSFAMNENYVRRIIRNRHLIKHITLVLDFTVSSRHAANTQFAAQNADRVLLTNNHSKTIYMRRGSDSLLAVLSNNATNNQRFEVGLIFRNHPVIDSYVQATGIMFESSVQWTS